MHPERRYKPPYKMAEQSLLGKYLYISFVVITYWVVSITLVFVNKALLSDKLVKLDAPLFVTWFQCIVTVLLCLVMSLLSRPFPHYVNFPRVGWDLEIVKQILPMSFVFVGMISFNNLCLKHVGVAFYYIGRSLTTVFNVLLTYIVLGQKTSKKALACCGIIVAGFWMGVDQEDVAGSLSVIGTIFGVLASLFVCLYSIYTKKVLPVVDNNILLLTYYNNVNALILFLPLMYLNNEFNMVATYDKLQNSTFWGLMVVGGVFGFAIGIVTGWQIKATSPLTHNVSGTAKACAQTVLATYWYSESKPSLWWVSNWIVLGGSASYARVKQMEMEAAHTVQKSGQNV